MDNYPDEFTELQKKPSDELAGLLVVMAGHVGSLYECLLCIDEQLFR